MPHSSLRSSTPPATETTVQIAEDGTSTTSPNRCGGEGAPGAPLS